MTELAVPQTVLDPRSGELVAEPAQVADVLAYLRAVRRSIAEGIKVAEEILIAESERQGTKTMRFGGMEAVVTGGTRIVWDVDVLEELVAAGLPQDRFGKLVECLIDYKVNAFEANRIAGSNPKYAEIIGRARRDIPTTAHVSVKGGT